MSIGTAVADRVKRVVVEQLGVDEEAVRLDASFVHDLGADSLDTVFLVMALEDKFGLDIPNVHAEQLTTVGEAIEYIIGRSHPVMPAPSNNGSSRGAGAEPRPPQLGWPDFDH